MSHSDFLDEVTERLDDEAFREQLVTRLHLDSDGFTDLNEGALTLKIMIGRLT